jgi:hypothetical protein
LQPIKTEQTETPKEDIISSINDDIVAYSKDLSNKNDNTLSNRHIA